MSEIRTKLWYRGTDTIRLINLDAISSITLDFKGDRPSFILEGIGVCLKILPQDPNFNIVRDYVNYHAPKKPKTDTGTASSCETK
jgi:hypothetical protein